MRLEEGWVGCVVWWRTESRKGDEPVEKEVKNELVEQRWVEGLRTKFQPKFSSEDSRRVPVPSKRIKCECILRYKVEVSWTIKHGNTQVITEVLIWHTTSSRRWCRNVKNKKCQNRSHRSYYGSAIYESFICLLLKPSKLNILILIYKWHVSIFYVPSSSPPFLILYVLHT